MEVDSVLVEQNQERDPFQQGEQINTPMTVLGLLNGMIGIAALMLPVIGIPTGYITSIWVCVLIGIISYWTAELIVIHLGRAKNIQASVLQHFNNDSRFVKIYGFFIWSSQLSVILGFFNVTCAQIIGLVGYQANWVGPLVIVIMLVVVILSRIYHYWEEVLAYGIASIVAILLFVLWALISAPSGPKLVPIQGNPFILASILVQAYSIHAFLPQNLLKNPNKQQFSLIVKSTFAIGIAAYVYVSLASFAIINRQPVTKHPTLLSEFFRPGNWPITLIQCIYIVHTISAYPTYLIVSMLLFSLLRIRFFDMFNISLKKEIQKQDVAYIVVGVLVSYLIFALGINLVDIYAFSGALIGYGYVFVIPISTHFKCIWIDRSGGEIKGDDDWNSKITLNSCKCSHMYSSKCMLYLQTILLICTLLFGLVMIYFTLDHLFTGHS